MSRKKTNINEESLMLPSDTEDMRLFIEKNKYELVEWVVYSIESGISKKLPLIEVFQFNNSDFVVTIPKKDFKNNLDSIYDFCIHTENYELCSKIVRLQNVLNKST